MLLRPASRLYASSYSNSLILHTTMNQPTLYVLSLSILLASFGLSFGLTYLPCYSAICVEAFFPYKSLPTPRES